MAVNNEFSVPSRQWKKFLEFGELPAHVFNETFAELKKDVEMEDNGNPEVWCYNAAYIAASHARSFLEDQKARLKLIG